MPTDGFSPLHQLGESSPAVVPGPPSPRRAAVPPWGPTGWGKQTLRFCAGLRDSLPHGHVLNGPQRGGFSLLVSLSTLLPFISLVFLVFLPCSISPARQQAVGASHRWDSKVFPLNRSSSAQSPLGVSLGHSHRGEGPSSPKWAHWGGCMHLPSWELVGLAVALLLGGIFIPQPCACAMGIAGLGACRSMWVCASVSLAPCLSSLSGFGRGIALDLAVPLPGRTRAATSQPLHPTMHQPSYCACSSKPSDPTGDRSHGAMPWTTACCAQHPSPSLHLPAPKVALAAASLPWPAHWCPSLQWEKSQNPKAVVL